MVNFMYPRTITIKRPVMPTQGGLIGYQGVAESSETTIASGVAASIEMASTGRNSNAAGGLPADSAGPIKYSMYLSAAAANALPAIFERDVIYDDLGRRFQVDAYQPTPIGMKIDTVRLMV